MQDNFVFYFQHHLTKLKAELEKYPSDEGLWKMAPGINNCAGNLCHHLLGNLNHYIGHALGDTGYVRNRPEEFGIKDVPRADYYKWIAETHEMLGTVITNIQDLSAPYPDGIFPRKGNVHYILLQMLTHVDYHLGQINYHRRMLFPETNV